MAVRTFDPRLSFFQFALIQHILTLFITMMAILTGKICFNMLVMRKHHRRPLFFAKDLHKIQFNFIGLSFHSRHDEGYKDSHCDQDDRPFYLHTSSPQDGVLKIRFSFLQPALCRWSIHLWIDPLGSTDAPGKGNHTGHMDTDGTITPTTKHTISPDDPFHLF